MRILMVWDSDYPWDIRVEKICCTLIERDYDVHLICRNRARRIQEEIYNRIYIHRIKSLHSRFGRFNDFLSFPAFLNPVWLKKIRDVVKTYQIDIIIVRDLPLSLGVILVAKMYNIPVVLDMAECYPEFLRLIWKYEPLRLQNIIIRNPFIADLIEKVAINAIDHIFVMVEESKDRLLKKGVGNTKISIISNTPVLSRFESNTATWPGVMLKHKGELILLYVGFLNYSRGLEMVLHSLKSFLCNNEKVFLVLLGTGTAARNLRVITKQLSIEKYVAFEGWIDNKLIPQYIASSDVCLVPHHKCSHWDNTIPNKLFDYMAAKRPVLVSDAEPIKRIVRSTNCGLIYEDNNMKSFISQLSRLQDKSFREQLGERGFNAVRERYNWGYDAAVMIDAISQVANIL